MTLPALLVSERGPRLCDRIVDAGGSVEAVRVARRLPDVAVRTSTLAWHAVPEADSSHGSGDGGGDGSRRECFFSAVPKVQSGIGTVRT